MNDTTSNRKFAKKARQIHNRFWSKALKPKPTWVPWWLWMWGLGIFLHYEKPKKTDNE